MPERRELWKLKSTYSVFCYFALVFNTQFCAFSAVYKANYIDNLYTYMKLQLTNANFQTYLLKASAYFNGYLSILSTFKVDSPISLAKLHSIASCFYFCVRWLHSAVGPLSGLHNTTHQCNHITSVVQRVVRPMYAYIYLSCADFVYFITIFSWIRRAANRPTLVLMRPALNPVSTPSLSQLNWNSNGIPGRSGSADWNCCWCCRWCCCRHISNNTIVAACRRRRLLEL